MNKDERRRLINAISPLGDRISNAIKWGLVKYVLLPGAVIAVLVILSLTKAPPQ